MATATEFALVPLRKDAGQTRSAPPGDGLWGLVSTWGLLLLLVYFALNGVSPFVNQAVATRAVATVSAGAAMADRIIKAVVFLFCLLLVMRQWPAVRLMCRQMRLLTAFPIIAILLCPLSQSPSRTISSACLLGAGILLLYYIMVRFKPNEVMELLLILGLGTIVASIVFALAMPRYGLDLMGGHDDAWKGIFCAKNYLGNIALFFLTAAISYRPRNLFFGFLRYAQILCCLVSIGFSRAATAYLLTVIYLAFIITVKALQGLRKKDYLFVCLCAFLAVSIVGAVVMIWPDSIIYLLGKDPTLTGRTQLWTAVEASIAKRPLLGYGYQGFWLGLEGESFNVILQATWMLSQAQNGYFDVMLGNGFLGFTILLLVFGFAYRDGLGCLLRSRDKAQLQAVEWYLSIVMLTMFYNLSESFLFDPTHLGSLMFLLSCIGLKTEWMTVRNA